MNLLTCNHFSVRILIIANRYHPALGGSELVQKDLAEGMVHMGHEVTVLVTDLRNSDGYERISTENEVINGVTVRRFWGVRLGKDPLTLAPGMFAWFLSHRNEFDIVVTFTYGYPTSWIPSVGKAIGLSKIPQVFHPHYGPIASIPEVFVDMFDATLGSISISASNAIVLLTPRYVDFFKKKLRDTARVEIIPPIVTPVREVSPKEISQVCKKFGIPHGKKIILSLGRVVEYKGIQHLLHGFAELEKKDSAVAQRYHLVIAGKGDYGAELKELAGTLGIRSSVTFTGEVDEGEKAVLYRMSFVFSLLSYSGESFGLVAVEAMSAGLPVIGSSYGAVPDVVTDEHDGIIVDPFNHSAVSRALLRIDSTELYEKLKKQAEIKSRLYSKENVLPRYEKLLKEVVEGVK